MAGMRLETENVRMILMDILDGMELFGPEGKDAEKELCYIAGAHDMANAVIKAIKELGGK